MIAANQLSTYNFRGVGKAFLVKYSINVFLVFF